MDDEFAVEIRKDEEDVLKALSMASEGEVSFTGMRRALGMHQEKLSRILKRLEKHGLVDRTEHGYRLSGKARKLVSASGTNQPYVVVDTLVEDVGLVLAGVASLRGRWVEELRWLSYSVEDDAHVLRWISHDGSMLITLRLKNSRLQIESNVHDRRAVRAALAVLRKAYELALVDDETPVKAFYATPFNIAG
ncbi:MAG: hypothetical protein RMK31_02800 [Candidatus Caldarchaeum sp.]|nr:hypothetical protein [Candidatus Caldarchaeum sp.]